MVRQGTREVICLRDVAYLDPGNSATADRVPPTAVTLSGTISPSFARADLYVGHTHYFVFGPPRTR